MTKSRSHEAAPHDLIESGTDVAFARSVRVFFKNHGAVSAGAIHFFNLDKVRQILVAQGRWERLSDRVQAVCQQMLEKRLDRSDLFHCLPGPIYVIVFAHLNPSAAKLKCEIIAEEIRCRLIGCDPQFEGVKVGVSEIDLQEKDDTLTVTALKIEADRIIAIAGGAAASAARADTLNWMFEDQQPRSQEGPWIIDDTRPSNSAKSMNEWYYAEGQDLPKNLSFAYLPLWHVQQRAIGSFLCVPALAVAGSEPQLGDTLFRTAPPELLCELDIAAFKKVTEDLVVMLDSGKQAILSLPIHFETLARSTLRRRYLSQCGDMASGIKRYLGVEILDFPQEAPAGRISQILNFMRPFSSRFSIRTDLAQTRFEAFKAANIQSAGVALGREDAPESEIIPWLNAFTRAAGHVGVQTYAIDLRTRSMTAAALGAGVNYLSGDMIGSTSDFPNAAYRFDLADIYAGLISI